MLHRVILLEVSPWFPSTSPPALLHIHLGDTIMDFVCAPTFLKMSSSCMTGPCPCGRRSDRSLLWTTEQLIRCSHTVALEPRWDLGSLMSVLSQEENRWFPISRGIVGPNFSFDLIIFLTYTFFKDVVLSQVVSPYVHTLIYIISMHIEDMAQCLKL